MPDTKHTSDSSARAGRRKDHGGRAIPAHEQDQPAGSRPDAAAGPMPFARLLGGVRAAVVHELTHQERLLVILRHAERMTPREIALVLGTTVEGVERMYAAVLERLRASVAATAC